MAVLGLIEVYWLGVQIPVEPGGTVTPGGPKFKPVIAGKRVYPAQAMMESMVECTSIIQTGDRVTDLPVGPGELQVHLDTGQVMTFNDAFIVEQNKFTAGEGGKLSIKWAASAGIEV